MPTKISIIIPSFNQAQYLEETLRSVLDQNYFNLELIVIDGGSTDGSIEVIKQYDRHLSYWISEPDRGQTHAINKGLAVCTGEVWSYLNSDDLLCPGSLQRIGECFQDPQTRWVGAVSDRFDAAGKQGEVEPQRPLNKRDYLTPWSRSIEYVFPCSNVCFMHRSLLEQCGSFDESYHYGMDIEYYLRVVFQTGLEPQLIPDVLGRWRWHSESKTMKAGLAYGFREDEVRMALQYLDSLDPGEQAIVRSEILEQQQWLVARKAMFYRSQGQRQKAFCELFSQVKSFPSLLQFRPWYGAVRALLY
jgi:glycosyltransferase involved in cell wall biosynthesis